MQERVKNIIIGRGDRILSSDRLYCRPCKPEGIDLIRKIYLEFYANSLVSPLTERSEAGCQMKLSKFINSYKENGISCFIVCDKNTNKPLGVAELTYMDDEKTTIEINYAFPQRSRKNGFGIEIAKAFTKFAFEELGLDEIYGGTLSYNTASHTILKKLGMQPKGREDCHNYKDLYLTIFSITKENFEASSKKLGKEHQDSRKFRDLILEDYRKKSHSPKEEKDKIHRATNFANIMRFNRDINPRSF